MTVLLTLLILGILIAVHELGHFSAAKMSDVKVHEFALGMGPKFLSVKKGETLYSLRVLPIGGFVRMAGEEPDDKDDPRSLNKKSPLTRMFIMSAGVIMNFLLAALILAIIFFTTGVPQDQPIIGEVISGMPAAVAGLQPGDRVLTVDNVDVNSWQELTQAIRQRPDASIQIKYQRNGQIQTIVLNTEVEEVTSEGLVGIGPQVHRHQLFTSLYHGLERTWWMIRFILSSLVLMVMRRVPAEGAGLIGVAQMVGEVSRTGFLNTLSFTAVLSISIGIFNLLPIPPLDGSRLVLLGVEAIRGKPIDPEKESLLHLIGFVMLILLVILVTYQDIQRLGVF